MLKGLHYHNIGLISRQISELYSRDEADTSIEFAGVKLSIPLIASPMPDVCDGAMAKKLAELGSYGFIHRFNSVDMQVYEYNISGHACGCAIGVKDDYYDRFQALYQAGCKSFVIDIANGGNKRIEIVAEKLKVSKPDIYLTVGTVASSECFEWISNLPVEAVRVGISGGAACTTRTETGIYYPMASSIMECYRARKNNVIIIADGGISEPQDLNKSLVLGADIGMVGSIFASTEESPAKTINDKGQLLKLYRGAASFSTQKSVNKNPTYVEGVETLLKYSGPLEKVIKRFRNGLRSSMSYANARDLETYRKNMDWCEI